MNAVMGLSSGGNFGIWIDPQKTVMGWNGNSSERDAFLFVITENKDHI